MNSKGNIAIVVLAAMGLLILLMFGTYAQQQLIHVAPPDSGRQTVPKDDPETSEPDETETDTATETDPVTEPPETETRRPTQPTSPPVTRPQETDPPATRPQETEPPATRPQETAPPETNPADPTEEDGDREDEFPLAPV